MDVKKKMDSSPKTPPKAPLQGEYGEGNYKATRDYNEGLKEHLATHDVEREAREAAPRTRREAEDMERAEATGRARARDGENVESAGKRHA